METRKSIPETFNEWRVFPRLFAILFGLLLHETHAWFTGIADPTTAQATYATGMVAAAAGFFKFYVDSGKKHATD